MLEYKVDQEAFEALDQDIGLMAQSTDGKGAIEKIYSGIYREVTTYHVVTHFMSKCTFRDMTARRKRFQMPFSLGRLRFPCSQGNFSNDGIDYVLQTLETKVCQGDDHIHSSDILCLVLDGSFVADTPNDFTNKLRAYIASANAVYKKFYPKGDERIELKFSVVEPDSMEAMEFECVKNNHRSKETRETRSRRVRASEKEEKPTHYGRQPRLIAFNDIGGLFEPKIQLREFLDDFYDPETALFLGLDPKERGGIFLFGDYGNGKTLLAEATAADLVMKYQDRFVPFFIDYSDLASEWRGVESKNTRGLFDLVNKTIREGKIVMLFLDEMQKIGQRTNCPANRHINSVLDQMLIETSRFDYGKCVLMAATAQDPSTIDQQLMRPGRFGTHVFVNDPTPEEALDILKKAIEKRANLSKYEPSQLISPDGISYDSLVQQTQGFTLADLYFLVQDVFRLKLKELRQTKSISPIQTLDFSELIRQRRVSKARTHSREAIL